MELLIKDGLILRDGKAVKANVLIEGGQIKKVSKLIEKADEILNASGCIVIPAFFNAHTHAAMTLLRCIVEDMPLLKWLKSVWNFESRMDERKVYWGTMLAVVEMIKTGTACFSDMYFHMESVAKAVEESGIRAVLSYGMIDMDNEEKREKELREAERFLRSTNSDRITKCVAPHSPYTCSKELLLRSVELAREFNSAIHIHVSETKEEVKIVKEKTGKTPVEWLYSLSLFDVKTVIAHGVWLSDEEIRVLAEKGVSVAHCPASNLKLGSGIARVFEMIDTGINVCLGTDGAASNNTLSVLSEMRIAALLQKVRKIDSIRAKDVFAMATENGYSAYSLKGGRIEEGYLADVAILKKGVSYTPLHNPLYSIVYSSYGFEVRDLIVDGRVLMREYKVESVDEEKVVKKAERAGFELVKHPEH